MATRQRRWLRAWDVAVAAVLVLLGVSALAPAPVVAQPFAAIVMDARSGETLHATNATARLHPASLTKMMTLYIAFEAVANGEISLDTRVRISRHAASQPPSRLGLRPGQRIAFRYLIRAAALRSANDAATAIAEALEGSVANFSVRMNRTAQAMGMTQTRFHNPHGLTQDGHMSTARDMAILSRQLYFDFPEYYNLFSRRSESAGIATVTNTNSRFLDSYPGADGIKTGFTNAAGYNLAAMAERNGVRILVVVMGGRSSAHRLQQVTALMDRGFREAPRRVALRRPARPDYVRAPEDSGTGPSAGRVIRLQTAPTASRFPRPRPLPDEAPPAELVAGLRSDIDAVIDDIREPDPETDTDVTGFPPDMTSEEPDEAAPVALAALATPPAAPDRSPVPPIRPEAAVDQGVTRAEGEMQAVAPLVVATTPEPRPELPMTMVEVAAVDPDDGGVLVEDGVLTITGLPPILTSPDDAAPGQAEPDLASAALDTVIDPADDESGPGMTEILEPYVPDLAVDTDGRLLWRDEELMAALTRESPDAPVLMPTIVLTTSTSEAVQPPPMPEIVSRASTSGVGDWAVELGLHPSRFDAERVLLRLALAESATLGSGDRQVTPRSGRFAAEIHNLSQEAAETACLRLVARNQPCSVMTP